MDEKTQIQALDRTQPLLPIEFEAGEKRTHDYVRHGTTNLFAVLNVGTGEVFGECRPTRDGANFLAFLKKAVKPHAGKEIHVVLDNLSTHTTPDVVAWLEKNGHVHFHFTPVGSSWINQIETWFGIITRQSIRRGTFSSVKVLITQIRDYIARWNTNPNPFEWTATADEILAKVRLVQSVVGLGEAVELDGHILSAVDLQNAVHPLALERDFGVGVVVYQQHVVSVGEVHRALKEVQRGDSGGRIVRIVEPSQLGIHRIDRQDRVEVQQEVVGGSEWHPQGARTGQDRAGLIGRIPGIGDDGEVARVEEPEGQMVVPLLAADEREHLSRRIQSHGRGARPHPGWSAQRARLRSAEPGLRAS